MADVATRPKCAEHNEDFNGEAVMKKTRDVGQFDIEHFLQYLTTYMVGAWRGCGAIWECHNGFGKSVARN